MQVVRDRKGVGLRARLPTASWLPVLPNGKLGTFRFQGSWRKATSIAALLEGHIVDREERITRAADSI
jgi:hypothetical protein